MRMRIHSKSGIVNGLFPDRNRLVVIEVYAIYHNNNTGGNTQMSVYKLIQCCAPLHMMKTGSSEQLNTLLKYGIDLRKNFELSENI
jgi:hypothetical protein